MLGHFRLQHGTVIDTTSLVTSIYPDPAVTITEIIIQRIEITVQITVTNHLEEEEPT